MVACALVAAGLAVVLLLRANLAERTALEAELAARDVAAQLAAGTPADRLDLPDADDHPVRVVDDRGRLRAADEDLTAVDGVPVGRPVRVPATDGDGDGDGDGSDRDHGAAPRDDDRGGDDDDGGRIVGGPRLSDGTAAVDGRTARYRFAELRVVTPDGERLTVRAGADPAAGREAVGTVVRAMLAGLPPLLAVVAAVTWLVTRRALRPVEAIRAELAAITTSGDLTRRVPEPRSRDEVAMLAATTNATLAALEESVARQRGFVADASHELRSPIASLRTRLEVAAAHPELLDLGGLVEDVVRLQRLAADLLLLARLDAGDRPSPAERAEPVDLADLVREEVARRSGRRVRIETDLRASPSVPGPRGRLARVLGNLLDNAERHASTLITVGLDTTGAPGAEGAMAVLTVADDGPGIPPADRERIFERFVRLDDARARDDGGAGLGLAIARDLVRAQGGTLAVGEAPAGGALFEVRLPLGRHGAPRSAARR